MDSETNSVIMMTILRVYTVMIVILNACSDWSGKCDVPR